MGNTVIRFVIVAIGLFQFPQMADSKSRAADPSKILTIWKASFDSELSASDAVQQECHMEELLNTYIQSNAPRRGAAIQFANSKQQFELSPNQLHVAIADVDSNEWRFPRVRPSSLVTFDIRIVIDDKTVKQIRKQIRSGGPFGFGVCQRVDKIAKAGGAFVAEWVARADYQTVATRSSLPTSMSESAERLATQSQDDALEAAAVDAAEKRADPNDPVGRLEQLEVLKSKKLITDQEYEAKRREIVESI